MTERVSIDATGRLVVPAKIRDALGLTGGEVLSMTFDGTSIKIQTVDAAIAAAQRLGKKRRRTRGSVVDDFIEERRRDAKKHG